MLDMPKDPEEIDAMIKRMERIEAALEQFVELGKNVTILTKDVHDLKRKLVGDSEPEQSILWKVRRLEEERKNRSWAMRLVIGAMIASIVGLAVSQFESRTMKGTPATGHSNP